MHFLVAYLQLHMVGGVRGDSHEFGLRPADLHPHKVGFFLKYYQSFLEHAHRCREDGDVIRVTEKRREEASISVTHREEKRRSEYFSTFITYFDNHIYCQSLDDTMQSQTGGSEILRQ